MRANAQCDVIELFDLVDEDAPVVRSARFEVARFSTL
jgi:hypothetical protein